MLRQQSRDVGHAGLGQPPLPLYEPLYRVPPLCLLVRDGLDSPPLGAPAHAGSRPVVLHLGVVACVEPEVAKPRQPSLRVDEPADLRLDVERARALLPRPAQKRLEPPRARLELRVRRDGAVVDDGPARGPPLRRHDVLLVVHAPAHLDEAVLQHHLRVAEDEVDGAADHAVAVVLPARVRVQRVLVPVELALVERRRVALHTQRHGLVVPRAPPCSPRPRRA
jgi:hypothetical protein